MKVNNTTAYQDALLTQALGSILRLSKIYNFKVIDKIVFKHNKMYQYNHFNYIYYVLNDKNNKIILSSIDSIYYTFMEAMKKSYKSKMAESVIFNSFNDDIIYTYDLHRVLQKVGQKMVSLLERINKKSKILFVKKDNNILGQIFHMFKMYYLYNEYRNKLRYILNYGRMEANLFAKVYECPLIGLI